MTEIDTVALQPDKDPENDSSKDAEIAQLRSENERLKARNTELEAFASKWATDAPLSERRTLHEASLAYRKAAGIFPNPEGVKAILDK